MQLSKKLGNQRTIFAIFSCVTGLAGAIVTSRNVFTGSTVLTSFRKWIFAFVNILKKKKKFIIIKIGCI